MTKYISVLSSKQSENFEAIKEYFKDKDTETIQTDSIIEASDADLCIVDEFHGHLKPEILECTRFIKIHYSLLPAFDSNTPVEDAFEAGVKISGVTINYINEDGTNGRIIAQYPVFLDYTTTLDEFRQECCNVSQKLAPFAAESVLNDVIFNFGMLLNPQGGCNACKDGTDGCSGCRSKKQPIILKSMLKK